MVNEATALSKSPVLTLLGFGDDVLVAERDGHHGDEEAEEQLQLPEAVLVEEEEGEGVHDGDEAAGPKGYPEWRGLELRVGSGSPNVTPNRLIKLVALPCVFIIVDFLVDVEGQTQQLLLPL